MITSKLNDLSDRWNRVFETSRKGRTLQAVPIGIVLTGLFGIGLCLAAVGKGLTGSDIGDFVWNSMHNTTVQVGYGAGLGAMLLAREYYGSCRAPRRIQEESRSI